MSVSMIARCMKMNIHELLLDFRITSHCHLGCDLCFRTPGIEDQTLGNIKKVISKMSSLGFRRIGFTGGEPTTRSDYLEMITYAKSLGFLTYLSTVGHKFIEHLDTLNQVLDWVGLPIDGIDYETNSLIRSASMRQQHEAIKSIFDYLSNEPTTVKIKLTSVVSGANIDHLSEIVSYVNKLPYKYNVWRFYQFCPLGMGKEKRAKLEVSTEKFLASMKSLQEQYPNSNLSGATFEERDKANVLMEPNFDVIIPEGENYSYLCNMQKDSADFIISAIMERQDILAKCEANRFWVS